MKCIFCLARFSTFRETFLCFTNKPGALKTHFLLLLLPFCFLFSFSSLLQALLVGVDLQVEYTRLPRELLSPNYFALASNLPIYFTKNIPLDERSDRKLRSRSLSRSCILKSVATNIFAQIFEKYAPANFAFSSSCSSPRFLLLAQSSSSSSVSQREEGNPRVKILTFLGEFRVKIFTLSFPRVNRRLNVFLSPWEFLPNIDPRGRVAAKLQAASARLPLGLGETALSLSLSLSLSLCQEK